MKFFKKLFTILIILSLAGAFLVYKMDWDFTVDSLRAIITKNSLEQGSSPEQITEKKAKSEASEEERKQSKMTHQTVPFVRMGTVKSANQKVLGLSGIVKARYETPLAFQVGGRVIYRNADAGLHIKKGAVVFKLDDRDVSESIKSAQADVNAAQANVNSDQENINTAKSNVSSAQAQLTTAVSELKRTQLLHNKRVISTQILEKTRLAESQARAQVNATKAQVKSAKARVEAAKSQVKVAKARLVTVGNTQNYTVLKIPASGTLLNINTEVGQVVAAGQQLAMLALDGHREVEVAFPDFRKPAKKGVLITSQGEEIPLVLREVSGAVDPQSRTWRARYSIQTMNSGLGLGSIVRTLFVDKKESTILYSVPISALDERGEGARIWQIVDGKAQPKPVQVHRLTIDNAEISGNLMVGEKLIALGTHLLTKGMRVQRLNHD